MKKLVIFLVVIIFVNCTTNLVRLANPKTETEKSKLGIVGFGIFIQTPKGSSLLISDERSNLYLDFQSTQFSRIHSIDEKTKMIKRDLFFPDVPIPTEKLDDKQYFISNLTDNVNPHQKGLYFAFLIDDPKLQLALTRPFSSYGCGEKTCTMNLNLNPADSFNVLPIKSKPGEILFLGNFVVNVLEYDTGMFGFGIKINAKIESATKFLLQTKNNDIKNRFFGNEGQNDLGMEINFLKNLASLQTSGYWKDLAESKIKKLSNSK